MTEDISSHVMISLTVYLSAFLLSVVISTTVTALYVYRNYTSMLTTAAGGNVYREFVQVATSSQDVPISGAQVYATFSDLGFRVNDCTCLDIENGVVQVTAIANSLSDSEIEVMFSRFYIDHADDYYTITFVERGSGIFDVTITQIVDGEPVG